MGLPLDLLGALGGITELGSDYLGPYGIRAMSAANGWRKATMWFDGNMWGPIVGGPKMADMAFYGEALWSVMHGLGSMSFWRHNYVVENGNAPAVARAYSMLSDLEALGVWQARPPRHIALLTSRASLDWWQIRAWWGEHEDPDWDRGVEGMRGWFAEQAAFSILQRNGHAFDWFFLDRLDQLGNLGQYDVLLIPFAWSVSREAAGLVRAAAEGGTHVVLLDGKMGPTDEWGERHGSPDFEDLMHAGKATLIQDDVLAWGGTDTFAQQVLTAIDGALAGRGLLAFDAYGSNIEASVLRKSATELFVFLLSWEKTGVTTVDLGLDLPEGRYQAFGRDENRWYRVRMEDKLVLTDADARNLRLSLGPRQPLVLWVSRVP